MSTTTHYCCEPCGRLFPQTDCHFRQFREPSEFWGQRGTTTERQDLCPYCGSEQLTEAHVCMGCQQVPPQEGSDCCRRCDEMADAIDRVTETGKYRRIAALNDVIRDLQRGAA